MGKYLRKSKTTTAELALTEVSHHHQQQHESLGVRTRAKTLALQRLAKSAAPSTTPFHDESSYLQLRSRRLVKPNILIDHKRKKEEVVNLSPNFDFVENLTEGEKEEGVKEIVESCIGENVVVEFEGRDRGTRETTPCSLIRDPNTIGTPGSTNRPANLTDSAAQNLMRRHIPTTHEMDEFFSGAEDEQQKQFIDKYNFDPMNEKPLPGRYEWVKVDP